MVDILVILADEVLKSFIKFKSIIGVTPCRQKEIVRYIVNLKKNLTPNASGKFPLLQAAHTDISRDQEGIRIGIFLDERQFHDCSY